MIELSDTSLLVFKSSELVEIAQTIEEEKEKLKVERISFKKAESSENFISFEEKAFFISIVVFVIYRFHMLFQIFLSLLVPQKQCTNDLL